MKNFLFIVVCFCSIFSANGQRTIGIEPIDGSGGTIIYPTSCIGNPVLNSVTTAQISATLNYTKNGTTSHHIEYRKYGTTTWTPIIATTSPQTISGLTCNTQYQFRIRKSCINGGYIYSTIITKYTTACTASTPILYPPMYANNISCSGANSLAATPNRFDVNLSWSVVVGATSYQLQYAKVGTTNWQPITPIIVNGTTSSLNGLAAGTYQWRVRANNSSSYRTSTFATNFTIDPIQIGYLSTSCPSDQICWNYNSSNCPDRYIVNYQEWVTTSVYTPHIGWELIDEGYVLRNITVYPSNTSVSIPADACDISVTAIKGSNTSSALLFGPSCPSFRQSFKKTTPSNNVITLSLSPNPTTGIFTVQGLEDTQSITVLDMTGKQIMETNANQSTSIEIDLSNYPAGMYLLKTDKGQVHKVVKQ